MCGPLFYAATVVFGSPILPAASNQNTKVNMRKSYFLQALLFLGLAVSSCKTSEKVVYLQDVKLDMPERLQESTGITIQPKDMLSIVISCKDPELAAMFNLPVISYQAGSEVVAAGGAAQRLMGYVVDEQGNIDFPILGKLQVAGLNRWELQEKIKAELAGADLLKDFVVTVEFMNFKVSILGEVNKPGSYTIQGDKITLLEALSMANDLTIYGKRDGVYVIREENGERTTYRLDLRSAEIFNSPVYYLKQNDIIYVEPNSVRAGQSTINENSMKSVSLWISVGSFLSSLGVLIFK